MRPTIYLDNAATTPMSQVAIDAMVPLLREGFGNPSSLHSVGERNKRTLEDARERCAQVLGCRPSEIVFTSGGTESDNAALLGVTRAQQDFGRHVVTTAIEHHAVLHSAELLERLGFEVSYVAPNAEGIVEPGAVGAALRSDTVLVSVMLANNEIGTVQPLAAIAEEIRSHSGAIGRPVYLHTDAVQAPGYLALKVDALGIDLLSLSAHKFNGPKGVGLLFIRRGTPFAPTQVGGGQERDRRAGTENVPGIAAMAVALAEAEANTEKNVQVCRVLRDRAHAGLLERIEGVHANGSFDQRLAGNLNVSFDGIESEPLLMALNLNGIAASSGSACTAGSLEPSHVLRAMGLPDPRSRASLRLSFSAENTVGEVDYVVNTIAEQVERLRKLM